MCSTTPLWNLHKQYYQANFDSHHIMIGIISESFRQGSHCSDGLRYRRRWDQDKTLSRSMSTPHVENTCTVSNIIGPIIYMGVFGFKCCPCHSTIRLLLFAVHVVSDSNSLFTDHLVNVPHKTEKNLDLANPNLSQTENV